VSFSTIIKGDLMAILKIRDANGTVQEILAIKGDDYVLTDADKQEIATKAVEKLSTETWTFTLEDGSTVNKTVVLK
jgi:hypothetical protein